MAEQRNQYGAQAGNAPRHGRHASSAPASFSDNDDVFNTQDIAIRSRHAASQPEVAPAPDLSGLAEYAYGAPSGADTDESYSYGTEALSSAEATTESVLPDKLRRKKGGAPKRVLGTIGKALLLLLLFVLALGLGALVGVVYLLDVNPLVLFAIK